jgi:predicted Zn-dependent peptidase
VTQTLRSHVFENGLVLLAEAMPWLESAAFTFLTPAGCCYDPADRQGLGSMVCEMALRGCGSRDSRAFIRDLENLGVESSESVSVAHANYCGATLATNLVPALGIYIDLLRDAHLPVDQLEAGRMVALQELQSLDDDPSHKLMIELRRLQYGDPWGRASQGERSALEAISRDEVESFYRKQYRPNGTILGVAGQFDWERIKDSVAAMMVDWESVEEGEITEKPATERRAHFSHDSNQTQIGISYDSLPYRHDDYFQAWAASGVLSGGMSSRLFTEVRERRGLCYTVYASHHTLRDRAAVLCYAGTSAERAQETLDVTLGELVRLADGIEQTELDRLKARIKSGLIMQQESSSSRSGSLARDWYHLSAVRSLDELSKLVDDLTCDSINGYLAEHPPRDFTVATLGAQPFEVPVGV